jgi:hypothetical protein
MRRLLPLILITLIAIALSSCNEQNSDNKSAWGNNEKTEKEDRDNLFSSPDEGKNQSSKQLKAIALEGAEVISFEDGRGKYYEICPIHGAHNRVRRSFSGSANSTYRSGFRCSDGNKHVDVKIEIVSE